MNPIWAILGRYIGTNKLYKYSSPIYSRYRYLQYLLSPILSRYRAGDGGLGRNRGMPPKRGRPRQAATPAPAAAPAAVAEKRSKPQRTPKRRPLKPPGRLTMPHVCGTHLFHVCTYDDTCSGIVA